MSKKIKTRNRTEHIKVLIDNKKMNKRNKRETNLVVFNSEFNIKN